MYIYIYIYIYTQCARPLLPPLEQTRGASLEPSKDDGLTSTDDRPMIIRTDDGFLDVENFRPKTSSARSARGNPASRDFGIFSQGQPLV